MADSVSLHAFYLKNSDLQKYAERIDRYLSHRPFLLKVALIINHLFRAATVAAFMWMLPFPVLVNSAICFGCSLFYRLTVETRCPYKFALPAFAGAMVFSIAKIAFMSSAALTSASRAFRIGATAAWPLCMYFAYIIYTVHHDVKRKPCCLLEGV